MFNYLLGIMAMTLYNQTYGTSTVATIMDRYNTIIEDAMSLNVFAALVLAIKSLAIGITILLYFIELSEKVTEKNFSIEQFFRATLRCAICYMFIMNSDVIVGYLMDLGASLSEETTELEAGYDFFSNEHPERKTMLINGLGKFKIATLVGYIVSAVIPWVISMIAEIILQVILISRILEIIVLTMFAPMAISDIYREGTSSSGVNYMKKMFALGLQVSVIILINIATQAIISELVGVGTGSTITSLLKNNGVEITEANLASGKAIFTKDSLTAFLDALVGRGEKLKVLGIMLARLGLIWNSMPLCEEITGAK